VSDLPASAQPSPAPTRRRRRWLTRLALAIVIGVLLVHAAGSWYYSDRIYDGALRIDPWSWERPFVVTSVDAAGHSITIDISGTGDGSDQQRDQLRSAGDYGLLWDGGFARTSGRPLGDSATSVQRTFELTSGVLPTRGAVVGVDSFAVPQGISSPWEKVTFLAPLGSLTAAYLPASGSVWAVMVHGKGAAPDEQFRLAETTHALGMPSLSITYRGDAGAPGNPQGRYGFGASEWPDLEAAVAYAAAHGARGVVLAGASMGGGIIAAYLRHAPDTHLVRAVVLDSPMLDLGRTVQWGADQVALPGQVPLPASITWGAKRLTSLRYGVDWAAVDYVDDPSWCRVPTLVLHGTADLTVPVTSSREFARAVPSVRLVEFPGAGHVESWNADRPRFEAEVRAFLSPLL